MRCPSCQSPLEGNARFCSKCGAPTSAGDAATATHITLAAARPVPVLDALLEGRYRLAEVLGRGGMGIVYKAEDTKLHRSVALKFLPPEHAGNPETRQRFLLEARAAAALSHPHICTVYEIHDESATPFIAMEYIDGQNLRARIKDQPVPAGEVVELAIQVAEGLAAAHAKGIVHRDIKSANIMVTGPASGTPGQAKVMDFGLAKVTGETLQTSQGTTLGTAAYMSPEQARGEPVDRRSDLWSFGVVLYEMLTGRLPFEGDRNASLLYEVVHQEPKPPRDLRPEIPVELDRVVKHALTKDLDKRYQSAEEIARDLRAYRDQVSAAAMGGLTARSLVRGLRKPRVAIAVAACCALAIGAAGWYLHRQSRIRWAREVALPEIVRLGRDPKAYALAVEAERYIAGDPELGRLMALRSFEVNVASHPSGARVYARLYAATSDPWIDLGLTPVTRRRMGRGHYTLRIEKDGYEPVLATAPAGYQSDPRVDVERNLDPAGKIPAGMVRVPGSQTADPPADDFFIDRYEVTNKQFKQFVDAGGYRERKYWTHNFVKDGKDLSWDQAIAEFVDQTGRPGPATWQAGDHPKGQDDFPVTGVSWYEAAAYAAYAGKSLPTSRHWNLAVGLTTNGLAAMVRQSNFRGDGLAAVGTSHAPSAYGAYDMAGNAREWCFNPTREGRVTRGGAWADPTYMVGNISQAPAFDRSPRNGFRCAVYIDPAKISAKLMDPIETQATDFHKMVPASDAVFQVYADQFSYDKKPLNAHLEWRRENADWVQERIVVDTPGGEKLPMHVFLPRRSSAPYQTVIYFPGSGAVSTSSPSSDVENFAESSNFVLFHCKNGRAVVFPIYKGTFERHSDEIRAMHTGTPTRQYTEYLIRLVQEFRTSIDYLETRRDIDTGKLAFQGFSWGSALAPIVLAVEPRIKTAVLVIGGLVQRSRPEASQINYVGRVRIPVLLLNGRYDMTLPLESSAKPLFDLLGTPAKDKMQKIYDSDHSVGSTELIKESLAWLDRYLGKVQ